MHVLNCFMKAGAVLFVVLVFGFAPAKAQSIDSFAIDRSTDPQRLFIRVRFPDASYDVTRILERVLLMYPPINNIALFFQSCEGPANSAIWETTLDIYTPEPYTMRLWLVKDSNTLNPYCEIVSEYQTVDSAAYDSRDDHGPGLLLPDIVSKGVSLFPNPAGRTVFISGAKGYEIRVSDLMGKAWIVTTLKLDEEGLDVSGLAPGTYCVSFFRQGARRESLLFSVVR